MLFSQRMKQDHTVKVLSICLFVCLCKSFIFEIGAQTLNKFSILGMQ